MGPVVDVEFDSREDLPFIKDALEVDNGGKTLRHGSGTACWKQCCALHHACLQRRPLQRDMEVTATGEGIKVPVGEQTLGRLFNVLGETIDDREKIPEDAEHWVIHREAAQL